MIRPTWDELREAKDAYAAARRSRVVDADMLRHLAILATEGWRQVEREGVLLAWVYRHGLWTGEATYGGKPKRLTFSFQHADGFVTTWRQSYVASRVGVFALAVRRAERERRRKEGRSELGYLGPGLRD